MSVDLKAKKNFPVFAVVTGFPPPLLLLVWHLNPSLDSNLEFLYFVECFVSVVCGILSSVLLFKRKTGLAITGGVLALIFDGFVSYRFFIFAVMSAWRG